jgi:hypothetical protein
VVRDVELGEHARGFLRPGKLLLGAEELQHAAGAVVEGDVRVRYELSEARLAVMGDALHARLVARETLGAAVAQEARQPAPLVRIEPRPQHDRRVAREQPACDLERQSRRRPRTGKSRADAAGIGEARFQRRAALAVDNDDLVSGPGEIVGAARSDHARAEHHHAHGGRVLVSRFRSSHHRAAPSFANFGIQGH